jgi:hypothetical protein
MDNRKSHYNKKGLYMGYDKNHKEREALDYYATDPKEVKNILDTLKIKDIDKSIILEPCAGGGHMLYAILNYLKDNYNTYFTPLATDIQKRELFDEHLEISTGKEFDFLSDDYPYTENIDYIIMNPPYSVIQPFVMKSLGIANKGVLILGRLQFLEGSKRYESIFKENPPTDIYVYVDRIDCYKNGDFNQSFGQQAYAWYYWDFTKKEQNKIETHFIRRVDKK